MKKILFMAAIMLMGVQNMNAQNESDNCGELIIPMIYDDVSDEVDGMILVTKGNKKGVIGIDGKIIVPIQYDNVKFSKKGNDFGGLIVVSNELKKKSGSDKEKEYGLYNKDGVQLASMDRFDYISISDRYPYEGFAMVWIFEGIRNDTLYYTDGSISEIEKSRIKKNAVLLNDGKLLSAYDDFFIEKGRFIVVKKDNKKGVLNNKGEVIIPIQFEDVSIEHGDGLIGVQTPYSNGGRKYGVFNDKGEIIVPVGKYESAWVDKTFIKVEKNGKKGMLNNKGVEIVPCGLYEEIYVCDDEDSEKERNGRTYHYLSIGSNGKKGAMNDKGKVFVPIGKYERFRVLNQNNTLVELNKKQGLLDKNGTMIVPIGKYDDLRYRYGVLTYSQNGSWGILDEKGNQATLAEYDEIKPARHSYGIALVKKEGKCGVIYRDGKIIIPLGEYEDSDFSGEMGSLKSKGETVIFKINGEILAPLGKYQCSRNKYGKLRKLNGKADDGLYSVESNGKYGVVKLW